MPCAAGHKYSFLRSKVELKVQFISAIAHKDNSLTRLRADKLIPIRVQFHAALSAGWEYTSVPFANVTLSKTPFGKSDFAACRSLYLPQTVLARDRCFFTAAPNRTLQFQVTLSFPQIILFFMFMSVSVNAERHRTELCRYTDFLLQCLYFYLHQP